VLQFICGGMCLPVRRKAALTAGRRNLRFATFPIRAKKT
jgi:hypothetical protein